MGKNMFIPVVEESKLNSNFKDVRSLKGYEPARLIMNELFQTFDDPDGNFLEQFQTTGFDSRLFELYLFSFFVDCDFKITRYDRPDYILTNNDGIVVALEATTVNPTQKNMKEKNFTSDEELFEDIKKELPIKFGSPLSSKLQKKYWELEHCKDKPFILAIEAFHNEYSLNFSCAPLSEYLYGIKQTPSRNEDGKLIIQNEKIDDHSYDEKKIPSGFFYQPSVEHVSGILFTNSGTIAKFNRMGYQKGYHQGNLSITRIGTCYNPDPNAAEPNTFSYNMDDLYPEETWGQGLVFFHNPNSLHPIPRYYFKDATVFYLENDTIKSEIFGFEPFVSQTLIMNIRDKKKTKVLRKYSLIKSITKYDFHKLTPQLPFENPMAIEKEWYISTDGTFLGTVFQDRQDKDWAFVVLKTEKDQFSFNKIKTGIQTINGARNLLLKEMSKIN